MPFQDTTALVTEASETDSKYRGISSAFSVLYRLFDSPNNNNNNNIINISSSNNSSGTHDPAQTFPDNTVFLNIYDIAEMNDILYYAGIGIHHTGIEVYGMEFAFGRCAEGSGVFQTTPKHTPPHIFREQLILGETKLTPIQVRQLIEEFQSNSQEWSGRAYHLLNHNCNNFTEALARRLLPVEVRLEQQQQQKISTSEIYNTGEREEEQLQSGEFISLPVIIPSWVNRVARSAGRLLPSEIVERMEIMDREAQGIP